MILYTQVKFWGFADLADFIDRTLILDEQGLITKEYMIVQNNFKFALDACIASYLSTLIIHSLADYWSFVMKQHTHVAKL